jgi:phage gpG-like protein
VISIKVNDAPVQALLNRLAQSVKNMQPALSEIGSTLVNNIGMGFKSSTSPYGEKWKPIGQAAILGRMGKNKGNFTKDGKISKTGQGVAMSGFQPLMSSGVLRNSITQTVEGSSVVVGTNVKYAATHQFGAKQGAYGRTRRGGPIPWGNIHARPFMPIRNSKAELPSAWRDEFVGILQRRLMEATQ